MELLPGLMILPLPPLCLSVSQSALQFVGQSDSALVVRLRETLHSQDCDLYVLKDAKPTTTHFDLYDVSLGNHNSSVTIEAPDGLYWIGVYGFQACDYTLSLEEGNSTDCPRNCSGHGACNGGLCVCTAPWAGDDCSTQGMFFVGFVRFLSHQKNPESGLSSGVAVTGMGEGRGRTGHTCAAPLTPADSQAT